MQFDPSVFEIVKTIDTPFSKICFFIPLFKNKFFDPPPPEDDTTCSL